MGLCPFGNLPNEFWELRTEAAQSDLYIVLGIESVFL